MTIATLCQNHSRRRVHEWRQQAVQAGRLQQHDSVTGRHHSRYGRAAHRLRRQRARRKPSHLFHTTPHVCTWRRILWRFFVKYFVLDLCHGCGSGMIRARQRAACREHTLASRLNAPKPWTSRDVTWLIDESTGYLVILERFHAVYCGQQITWSDPPCLLKRPHINFSLHSSYKEDTSPEIFLSKFYEVCDEYKSFCRLYTWLTHGEPGGLCSCKPNFLRICSTTQQR